MKRLEYKDIGDLIERLKLCESIDVEKALYKVLTRIGFIVYRNRWTLWKKIASFLFLPLSLGLGVLCFQFKDSNNEDYMYTINTLKTSPGVIDKVLLPDGSEAILNSGSKLVYPLKFNKDYRKVYLDGEAFFKVKKSALPFTVETSHIDVKVHGTSFNLSAFSKEHFIEVALVEGAVELDSKDRNKSVFLKPGERFLYYPENEAMHVSKIDMQNVDLWVEGKLSFINQPLDVVIERIARFFNVDIKIANPVLCQYTYTATFENETLWTILNLLKRATPIDYNVNIDSKNTQIIIYKRL